MDAARFVDLASDYAVSLRMSHGVDRRAERSLHRGLAELRGQLEGVEKIDRQLASALTEFLVACWGSTAFYSGDERLIVEESVTVAGEAVLAVLNSSILPPYGEE